jgi:hypothetical protein
MSLRDKGPRFWSWLAALSWLLVAVLLAIYIRTPAPRLEAPTLAWLVTLAVVAFLLGHPPARRHGGGLAARARRVSGARWLGFPRSPTGARGQAPRWYKGRSHSGERPRFD